MLILIQMGNRLIGDLAVIRAPEEVEFFHLVRLIALLKNRENVARTATIRVEAARGPRINMSKARRMQAWMVAAFEIDNRNGANGAMVLN